MSAERKARVEAWIMDRFERQPLRHLAATLLIGWVLMGLIGWALIGALAGHF